MFYFRSMMGLNITVSYPEELKMDTSSEILTLKLNTITEPSLVSRVRERNK